MHMADALLSPAVGGVLWAAAAGTLVYSSKKVQKEIETKKIPLMGVLGAFIFAAQMINFSIPATGSSGHLGGGMILAILLGPYAGFLTISSVLIIQALFFADGGLLALGCNIINLGFFPCFIAYPFIYQKLKDDHALSVRSILAVMLSVIIGLQIGSLCVVLETFFSGVSELTFGKFLLLMQPIHLAIGFIEGMITLAVVSFVWKARPDIINQAVIQEKAVKNVSIQTIVIVFFILTLAIGSVFSWFASSDPDGLEWAVYKTTGHEELSTQDHAVFSVAENLQEKLSFLPDYGFKHSLEASSAEENYPAVSAGTSVSGLVGGLITLLLVFVIGVMLRFLKVKIKR
ncbi:MAG: energy-coupling factor ABC transporter permease [Spirochaetes bacterium]|nr:energy-coupling factor ABC transporter permease [Spirochaetota bacterium]